MPRIADFYGIAVYMYYNEHGPPHFHALYGGYRATVGMDSVQVLRGSLPHRAESLVLEWAGMHQRELAANWAAAREYRPLQPIAPLE